VFEGKHSFKLTHLLWERDTTPYARKRDKAVASLAAKHGVTVETLLGHTLLDIDALIKQPGFKAPIGNKGAETLVEKATILAPLSVPKIPPCKVKGYPMFTIAELGYESSPTHSVKGGEREGLKVLSKLCADKSYVCTFDKTKTRSTTGHTADGKLSTTGLSPYLMCGAVSARTVYHRIRAVLAGRSHTKAPASLLGQIYFREMFYLLAASTDHFDKPSNKYCLDVEWAKTPAFVKAWTEGRTGYPYIDALMRQLKETGWMHHLGRHAVSCFLTRGDLWQSWTVGRDVFHKLLIDADGCLNNGNWQALAGVAPWSSPWFRIYCPIPGGTSALNVDLDGAFIKHFVKELKNMPAKYIFQPWIAPKEVQEKAKCIIGRDYPAPIVDHKKAPAANLAKFKAAIDKRSKAKGKAVLSQSGTKVGGKRKAVDGSAMHKSSAKKQKA
jgi:cryptochrome